MKDADWKSVTKILILLNAKLYSNSCVRQISKPIAPSRVNQIRKSVFLLEQMLPSMRIGEQKKHKTAPGKISRRIMAQQITAESPKYTTSS